MKDTELLASNPVISSDLRPDERRAYERYLVDFFIRIIDERDGTILGDVVDISLGGMKLMSEAHLPSGGTYTVRLDLAMESGFKRQVSFAATSAWAKPSEDGKHFYIGLQYLRPTAEFLQVVHHIIAELQ
ncbi:MAG: PilZ domain-containing protein [Burkholderiales bacterium]